MDQDPREKSPPINSPPMSPDQDDSLFADENKPSSSSNNPNAGGGDKRQRDPHRKEIECRAADKRKSAVKRLNHVLAARTRGLPENGLANQLHMASDQLEEDGKTIISLKKEASDLKKQNATLKSENASLRSELQALKGR